MTTLSKGSTWSPGIKKFSLFVAGIDSKIIKNDNTGTMGQHPVFGGRLYLPCPSKYPQGRRKDFTFPTDHESNGAVEPVNFETLVKIT